MAALSTHTGEHALQVLYRAMSAPSVSGCDSDSAAITATTGRRSKRAFVAHRPLLHSRVPSYGRNLNKLAPAGGGALLPRPGSGLRLESRLQNLPGASTGDGDGDAEWGEMSTETSREHSSDGTNAPASAAVIATGTTNGRPTTTDRPTTTNGRPTTTPTPKVRFNTGDSGSDNDNDNDNDDCRTPPTPPPARSTPRLLQRQPSSILAPTLTPHTAVSISQAPATSPARSSAFVPDSPHRRASPSPPPLSSHGPNRTQQKIWLQRQASGYSHNANPHPIVPHPRMAKDIDRIARELASIRLFRDPLAESVERVCGRGISFCKKDSLAPSTSRSLPKHVETPSLLCGDVKYCLWNP